MKRKIKLGIIGTGIAAKNLHLPALNRLADEFEITAVCNHTEPKAKEFAKLAGNVPYYLNYKKLLKDKNIEAVDIALPIELNYTVTKAALKAGKHVFVEKPVAASMKESNKMVELNKKFDKILMVAENYRYRKVYRKAKEVLESLNLGKPYAAQWNVFYYNPPDSLYGSVKWRQNHVYPGGFITDGGVHQAAALRYLFGEPVEISSVTDSVTPEIGTHDTMYSLIKFNSGVNVNLNMFFSAVSHTENRLLIFCKNGTIEINDYNIQIKKSDASVETEDFGNDSGFYEEFKDFHSAVTTGSPVRSTVTEACKDLELILTILTSAKKNKIVKL